MNGLPEVSVVARQPHQIEIELSVPAEAWYFPGHFPGAPIVPGFLLLGWAYRACQEQWERLGQLVKVSQLKFLRQVFPASRLRLTLRLADSQGQVSIVRFSYNSADDSICTGQLYFG